MPFRPPLPPFTPETASQKARLAEDTWNSCRPATVALAYTEDSRWRNRVEFIEGRAAIIAFLERKWAREFAREFDCRRRRRIASINDLPIAETDRKFRWPVGRGRTTIPGSASSGSDAAPLSLPRKRQSRRHAPSLRSSRCSDPHALAPDGAGRALGERPPTWTPRGAAWIPAYAGMTRSRGLGKTLAWTEKDDRGANE
jgi:uncharacterized protein